jgi:hypothetical protein
MLQNEQDRASTSGNVYVERYRLMTSRIRCRVGCSCRKSKIDLMSMKGCRTCRKGCRTSSIGSERAE